MSKRSQSQKAIHRMFLFIGSSRTGKAIILRNQNSGYPEQENMVD